MSAKAREPFDPKVLDQPKRDDGGPAFARAIGYGTLMVAGERQQNLEVSPQRGMSLRDYFAAQVLPAVYAHALVEGGESQEIIAQEAYELADAMLEARAKS